MVWEAREGPDFPGLKLPSSLSSPHTPSDGQPRSNRAAGRTSRPTWDSCASSSSALSRSRWTCGDACWSWSTTPWRCRSTPPATCSSSRGEQPLPCDPPGPTAGPGTEGLGAVATHCALSPRPESRVSPWGGAVAAGSTRSLAGHSSGGRSSGRNPTARMTARRTQTRGTTSQTSLSRRRWLQPGRASRPWWASRRSCASRRCPGFGGRKRGMERPEPEGAGVRAGGMRPGSSGRRPCVTKLLSNLFAPPVSHL